MIGCANGFLEEEITKAEDVIKDHIDKPLIVVRTEELVSHAIERMRKYKISQIPVIDINFCRLCGRK
jgi:cystathionine beta-synthase